MHAQEAIQYGKWMIAKRSAQVSGLPSLYASFVGRFGGHGTGGRGEGPPVRKRPSNDAFEEEDLSDTDSSRAKKSKAEHMGRMVM